MKVNKKNKAIVDVNNQASYIFDKDNMPDLILLTKNTNLHTSTTGDRLTTSEKKDVILAAFELKDGKTISKAVVYEPIHTKDIKNTFEKIIELNNLEVMYNVVLKPSYNTQPKSSLGNGAYKAAKISDYKQY